MPLYMLDTDISVYIIKRSHEAVLKRLSKAMIGDVCISAVTQAELAFGVEASQRKEQNQAELQEFLKRVLVLDYPGEASAVYGEIRADLKRRGEIIGSNDLLIAAHARFLGVTLVTNNLREFKRVKGLKVENWAE